MISLTPRKGYDVLVNVTDVCDARCVMCGIWKNPETADSFLPAELLRTVHPLASVSFAGGEPFLHEQIEEIVRTVHANSPRAKVVFSSNGFRTDAIVARVERLLRIHDNLQVTLSLDGVGRVHDRIRGIPGAWEKTNKTFDRLGEIGLKQRNFAFTITPHNVADLPNVFAHAKSRGAGLSLAVAQSSRFLDVELPAMDPEKVLPHLAPVITDYLRSANPWNWARAFFFAGILHYLQTGRRPIACDALDRQFMISQTGTVYTCHPLMWSVGSLRDQDLPSLLGSEKAQALRPEVRACHACWEVCTARSSIRSRLPGLAAWVAGNKMLAHAGRWDGRRPMRFFRVKSEIRRTKSEGNFNRENGETQKTGA